MEILNIRYKEDGLAKVLSNLYPHKFELDGCKFESFEGFIQSLKTPDINIKNDIWKKCGYEAWKSGECLNWYIKQELYWIETPIDRHSSEYDILITRAYDSLYEQNSMFKDAIKQSLQYKLEHTIGKSGKNNTILTKSEFLYQLNRLRNKLTERKFFNLFDND